MTSVTVGGVKELLQSSRCSLLLFILMRLQNHLHEVKLFHQPCLCTGLCFIFLQQKHMRKGGYDGYETLVTSVIPPKAHISLAAVHLATDLINVSLLPEREIQNYVSLERGDFFTFSIHLWLLLTSSL